MANTKEGGLKVAITNKRKYGEDYYKKIGALGGKAGKGHIFGHGKVDPSVIGKIGGKKSKPYSKTSRPVKKG